VQRTGTFASKFLWGLTPSGVFSIKSIMQIFLMDMLGNHVNMEAKNFTEHEDIYVVLKQKGVGY
jgi:hypothetical protein